MDPDCACADLVETMPFEYAIRHVRRVGHGGQLRRTDQGRADDRVTESLAAGFGQCEEGVDAKALAVVECEDAGDEFVFGAADEESVSVVIEQPIGV